MLLEVMLGSLDVWKLVPWLLDDQHDVRMLTQRLRLLYVTLHCAELNWQVKLDMGSRFLNEK